MPDPETTQQRTRSLWDEVRPAVRTEMDALVTDTMQEVLNLCDQYGAETAIVLLRGLVKERTARA